MNNKDLVLLYYPAPTMLIHFPFSPYDYHVILLDQYIQCLYWHDYISIFESLTLSEVR